MILSDVDRDKIFLAISNLYFFKYSKRMQMDFIAAFLLVPMPDFEFVFLVRVVAANQGEYLVEELGLDLWASSYTLHTHTHTHFDLVNLMGLMFIPIIHIIRIYFWPPLWLNVYYTLVWSLLTWDQEEFWVASIVLGDQQVYKEIKSYVWIHIFFGIYDSHPWRVWGSPGRSYMSPPR